MGQAVDIGRRMGAKNIILTHFSARYPKVGIFFNVFSIFVYFQVPALPHYLDELGNVGVAMDNMSVRYDRLPLLPKLIPVYREVYKEELFEIELRKEQRDLKSRLCEENMPVKKKKLGDKIRDF